MSAGETQHRDLGDMVRAATLERAKPGGPIIVPWRINANQDHLQKDPNECGCGFCPDDDSRETT
jgi:hypothetical protein